GGEPPPRRAEEDAPGARVEGGVVAGALEAPALGRPQDRAPEVRAAPFVGHDGVRIEADHEDFARRRRERPRLARRQDRRIGDLHRLALGPLAPPPPARTSLFDPIGSSVPTAASKTGKKVTRYPP